MNELRDEIGRIFDEAQGGRGAILGYEEARPLAEKVAEGALSETGAAAWARAMLYENPMAAYRLDAAALSE